MGHVHLPGCSGSTASKSCLVKATEDETAETKHQALSTAVIATTKGMLGYQVTFVFTFAETHCNKDAFPLPFGVPGLSAGDGQEGFISSVFTRRTSLSTELGQQTWHFASECRVSHKWNADDWWNDTIHKSECHQAVTSALLPLGV